MGSSGGSSGGGGGGVTPTQVSAWVTSGDVVAPNDAAYAPLAGLSLSIAAAVGDKIEMMVMGLLDHNAATNDYFEPAVIVSGAIARYASTGTSSPAGASEGDPVQYPDGARFNRWVAGMSFTVGAGDLDAGNVVFGIVHKGPGGGKVFANAYTLRWWAINLHH